MKLMKELLNTMPQQGQIQWIGLRRQKREALLSVDTAKVSVEKGLEGDHHKGRNKKRQITLIQAEYLDVVASILKKEYIDPQVTRRNIMVSGINLQALKDRKIRLGKEVVLEVTGECHPCSRMETNLGPGGYNAMRSHGGVTAKVIQGGTIYLSDEVVMLVE
ncbi:MAG: MOSC domain-containing protein [Bacteroidota bacterium]